MTWVPNVTTQEQVEDFVEDLMAVTPEVLGIDETIPGCEIIDMDPYGVGAGTLPRYIKVAIRGYYQDVFYRGGLTGLSAGDYVTVTHLREGNRYEVTGAGGGSGTVPSPPPDPVAQGQALVSDAVPEWVASLTPTWLGTHTWGSGFALMPTDAAGQDLGDATHRWDLYTQAVYFGGATGTNVITIPDNVADALHVSDAGGLEHLRVVSTNANPYFLIDPAGAGVDVGIGTPTPEGKLDVAYGGNVGRMTLLLGADVAACTRTNVTSKRTLVGAYHYTNVEEPVGMMYVFSSSLVSRLDIGGGTVLLNAATEVSIYTAANRTTPTGTKRFSVSSTGAITVTGPSMTVPDGWWLGIGAAAERIVIDTAGYIVFRGCNVGVGLAIPNQKLTVEGTIDLKEQAAANPDTAAYGQIWVKDAAPNELWFTDDTGVDVQLGLGAGGLPAVAGAGYALISDGVNSWVADQTPAWTGEHSFGASIAFTGATGVNAITIPDNLANALHIIDAGDADVYLQIVTTTGSEEIIFNAGGDDVDFTVQAIGVADAIQVQGSDGQITLGVLTAGYVKSSAGGVLSVATEVPLIDLGSYTQGDLIYGGAADWQDLAIGGIGDFLWVNAAGTEPEWHTLVVGDIPAHALLSTQHSDTTTDAPTRGSLICANATPLWDELDHPLAAGYALTTDATDVVWDQTPTWTGEHSFGAGVALTGASGANEITVPDNIAIALELLDAGGLEYMRVVSTDANPYFLIDPAAAGIKVGIGTATPQGELDVSAAQPDIALTWTNTANYARYVFYENAVSRGSMQMIGSTFATVDRRYNLELYTAHPDGDITLWPNGVEEVRFEAGGNVGIGTPGPSYKLDVNSATTNTVARFLSTDANADILLQDDTGYIRLRCAAGEFLVYTDSDSHIPIATLNGNVGFGTTTIPHGAVGYAKFAIEGTNASAAGPHVQFTTNSDDYPLIQILAWQHDSIALAFDAYYDGADRSSDAGSNARIRKGSDKLYFQYDSGVAQGAVVTWNDGIVLDLVGGRVGIVTTAPVRELHVGDGTDATFQTYVGITANVAGIAQVSARNSTNNVEIGMFAHTAAAYMGTWTNHQLNLRTNNVNRIEIAAAGAVKITNLAGVGVRNVVAAADGTLSAP